MSNGKYGAKVLLAQVVPESSTSLVAMIVLILKLLRDFGIQTF